MDEDLIKEICPRAKDGHCALEKWTGSGEDEISLTPVNCGKASRILFHRGPS